MMRGLSHARLLEVLHYCPSIGAFWWKTRPDITHLNRIHNSKFAGKMAGRRNSKGYGVIKIDGTDHLIHRLAWFYMTGSEPSAEIDHENTRRLDNAFDNLREATRAQNVANTGMRSNNTTGFKGVFKTKSGRFKSQIKRNRNSDYLGTFDTPEEAHAAFAKRAVEASGSFARTE